MFCKKCGKEIFDEKASACPYCGCVLENENNSQQKRNSMNKKGLAAILVVLFAVVILFSTAIIANNQSSNTDKYTAGSATTEATTIKAPYYPIKELYYPTVDEYMDRLYYDFPLATYVNKSYDSRTNITTISWTCYNLSFSISLIQNNEGRIEKAMAMVTGDYSRGMFFENVFYNESAEVQYYIVASTLQPLYILACEMVGKSFDDVIFEAKTDRVFKEIFGSGYDSPIYGCNCSMSIADNRTMLSGFVNWE